MRKLVRSVVAVAAAAGALLGAKEALAAKGGIVFLHGTGDYPGSNTNGTNTVSCTGTGDSFKCVTPSLSGKNAVGDYWTQAFIDSARTRSDGTRRPYLVAGCWLGSRMPWLNGSPISDNDTSVTGESGTATCFGAQVERFIMGPDNTYGTADDITDLVIITHSGGSNVARHILVRYTDSTAWTRVKTATKKIIGMAPPHKGTYLANYVFGGGSTSQFINGAVNWLAGVGGYSDDGVKFIQTGQMDLHNNDTTKLKVSGTNPLTNPVNGITIRSGYGTYPDAGVWDGKTFCGGYQYQAALNLLHRLYLSTTEASTYRNGCSDGFLTCQSMAGMGQVFNIAAGSETSKDGKHFLSHHQSRREKAGCSCSAIASSSCYSTTTAWDRKVRAEVQGTTMAYSDSQSAEDIADSAPTKWDVCKFATPGWRTQQAANDSCAYAKDGACDDGGPGSSYSVCFFGTDTTDCGLRSSYQKGCPTSWLGDGWCDWDCLAVYGRDAVPTWNNATTKDYVVSWGTDDCNWTTKATRNLYSTSFNGDRDGNGALETYDVDAASACPDSFFNDGYCDECVLAKVGSDGNDCRPGFTPACVGEVVESDVAPGKHRVRWMGVTRWSVQPAVCGNGRCEYNECSTCASDCTGYCN